MSELKFPKEKTKKKGYPIQQASFQVEKEDVTYAGDMHRPKNITYLAVRIGYYQRNMD